MEQRLEKPMRVFESLEFEPVVPPPITTEKAYRHTLETVASMKVALDDYRERGGHHLDPRMRGAVMDSMQSLIDEWGQQARDYEALKNGSASLSLHSLRDLPTLLVRARIAAGLSQKQLAEKLGLKPQQIQRYEATHYRTITLERMIEVAEALGLKLSAPVSLS